jgi:hypothetical protein
MPSGGAKPKSKASGTEMIGGGAQKEEGKYSVERDAETLDTHYEKLERGRYYVKIHELRSESGLSRERFDESIKKLRDSGHWQLQDGDTDYFTREQIDNSFIDENGFRFLTVMRRKDGRFKAGK